MGAWVVSENSKQKKFQNVSLNYFGSHSENSLENLPYITVAVAIGSSKIELEKFIKIFKKNYIKIL